MDFQMSVCEASLDQPALAVGSGFRFQVIWDPDNYPGRKSKPCQTQMDESMLCLLAVGISTPCPFERLQCGGRRHIRLGFSTSAAHAVSVLWLAISSSLTPPNVSPDFES